MCGRYTLTTLEGFEPFFEINDRPDLVPRYNIAPSQEVPVVVAGQGGRRVVMMRWGLVPFWSSLDKAGSSWINARSESADRKATFKESYRRRRCLIPSDGFYEWIKSTPKRPVHFRERGGGLFAYAGLWDRWVDPGGEVLLSCAILTTPANSLVARVHDRMPAILERNQFSCWVDHEAAAADLKALLKPLPAKRMEAVEVSRFVSSPFNEGPECLQPVADPSGEPAQGSLF